jgi:hypothetical protein
VALGIQALQANTTAANNTAVGYQAGFSNTTGSIITAVGYQALLTNTGDFNTAVGGNALKLNTSGAENSAFGLNSLLSNTTGSYNVGIGKQALNSNTTASNNTAVGYQAAYNVTTAAGVTLIGNQTGYNLTTGVYNTFVGNQSGISVTTGTRNTIIGSYSGNNGGLDIRTASNYIVLSDGDGNPRIISNGSGQIIMGRTSILNGGTLNIGYDNSSVGGLNFQPSSSTYNGNAVSFYNASNVGVGYIYTNSTATIYSTTSDYRLKENVQPMTNALDVVSKLNPVTYDWISDKSKGQGFIAHELQAVLPECVTGIKDAVDENGKPIYQGIDTSFLVATLVSAIQELTTRLNALEGK